jgi:hypothetical protein
MQDSVQIINEALHSGTAPDAKQLPARVVDRLTDGGEFCVEVFDEESLRTEGAYLIRFKPQAVAVSEAGGRRADISLRVSRRHLEQVCENPASYRANPLCIDVVWLKSRLTA